MKKPLTLLFSLIVLLLTVSPASPVEAQGSAPVLAYYYAWWAPQAVGPGKSPDWPVTPYDSWDSGVIQQHVSQAAGAGIDGLVVAWYGPTEYNNQTETNFRMILDQASANGTTALLSVDLGSASWFKNTQEVIDGLTYALNVHAQHPAYFRYNGKPVLFFWYQGRYSLSDWAAIRQQVDPNHTSIWIAEGAALDTMPTFDGLHMYTISWADNPAGTLATWSSRTNGKGGYWVATAMPGWDNTYTQQSEKYIRDRQDGAFYRETFSGAAASNPHMIVITSWNEWWEGTHIEPSTLYGDFYLNLTRQLISEYNGSGAVSGGGIMPAPPIPATPIPVNTQSAVMSNPTQPAVATPTTEPLPTLPATITPQPTQTPTQLPATQVAEIPTIQPTAIPELISPKSESEIHQADWIILITGGIAGLLGLGLIGAVVIAYRRTEQTVKS